MTRPALKKLLEDIDARKVDTVVVYKVDRLTRSLADFAKIVETFDKRSVSFVSVTQQFNTTSSMGRLTLNVLLSFAQFEREVTGERIRDKVAASKKKGMWMGGVIPLGYDLRDRNLIINEGEAETVKEIFTTYLRFGCARRVKEHLDGRGVLSKVKISRNGLTHGGVSISRGSIYHLLSSRIYIGEIVHKDQVHTGLHEPIIDIALWEKVQAKLAESKMTRRSRANRPGGSVLTGIIFDTDGNRYTPTHTTKNGRRYRYYTLAAVHQGQQPPSRLARIPASEIEELIYARIRSLLGASEELLMICQGAEASDVRRVTVAAQAKLSRLTIAPAQESIEFLRAIVTRVVIGRSQATVCINVGTFLNVLYDRGPSAGNRETDQVDHSIMELSRRDLVIARNTRNTAQCRVQYGHFQLRISGLSIPFA